MNYEMNYVTHRFNLDLRKKESQMSISAFQYDTAIKLAISLSDGSTPYHISDGVIAVLRGKRANGEPIVHTCSIEGNTRIIYEFNNTTASEIGIVDCQIELYKSGEQIITAPKFIIVVGEKVLNDAEVVDDETFDEKYSALKDIFVAEADRVKTENDRVIAEADRVKAENERVGNERIREEKEQSRKSFENDRQAAEHRRENAETARENVETERASGEIARQTAENARVSAESERDKAEKDRENFYLDIFETTGNVGLRYNINEDTGTAACTGAVEEIEPDIEIGSKVRGYPVTDVGNSAFKSNFNIRSVEIPNSINKIGNSAFLSCQSLERAIFTDSSPSIGTNAFDNCTQLKEVHIRDIASWCNISFENYFSNPLYYAKKLYLSGELVTDLVIPNTVTIINSYAFYRCRSLTSVTILNGVTTIGDHAFHDCTYLESVVIPKSVTSIGSRAFARSIILGDQQLHVYFTGSEEEWSKINFVGPYDPFDSKTTIHYNYVSEV